MNHCTEAQLYAYISTDAGHLTTLELKDFLWLLDQLREELRQRLLTKQDTPH